MLSRLSGLMALAHYTLIFLILGSQSLVWADDKDQEYELDWVPWQALTQEQQKTLPIGSCGAYIAPLREDDEATLNPLNAPIRASANASSFTETERGRRLLLIGDTLITQGYRQLEAQQAEYDQGSERLTAEGDLVIREPGLLIHGNKVVVDQTQGALTIDEASYVFHGAHTRGTAKQINRQDEGKMVLSGADFTQCQPGNSAWKLKGSRIVLNFDSRQGYATHVRLVVHGVPVFYFPYLRFPLGNERLTGFLAPAVTYDNKNGSIRYSIPFYLNLAPNYDLLLSAHHDSLHGTLYESNFRHLGRDFYAQFNLAQLNEDRGRLEKNEQSLVDNGSLTEEDIVPFRSEDRWLVNIAQTGGAGKPWSTNIDYTKVSDIDFFRDFDQTDIASSSDNHLDQRVGAGYDFSHWDFDIEGIQYQTLNVAGTTPYRQVPAITGYGNYQWRNWSTNLENEWIRFDHADADDDNPIIIGDRTRLDYALKYDYAPTWGFVRPEIKLRHLSYQLDDTGFTSDAETSPSITAPQFSVDTGLFFERNGNGYLQTFEPRLYYLHSSFQDHSVLFDLTSDGRDIDFDTSELGFSFNQVFRDTRFSGGDRLDDANQISLGLTTRFIGSQSGREWFSASLGRIVYLEDRRVTLNNQPQEEKQSDIAIQLRSNPMEQWRITSDLRYGKTAEEASEVLKQGNLGVSYRNKLQHGFKVNYRYSRGASDDESVRQFDASFITPLLSRSWHLLFYGAYDYTNSRELDLLSAVEYINCCYKIRMGYRHELDTDLAGSVANTQLGYDFSTFFEVQFRGLGSTGKQLDLLLDENIEAYSEWQATHYQ